MEDPLGRLKHDLTQPLNVVKLAVSNMRRRLPRKLAEEDCTYLEAKLLRIDEQVTRMADIIDQAAASGKIAG